MIHHYVFFDAADYRTPEIVRTQLKERIETMPRRRPINADKTRDAEIIFRASQLMLEDEKTWRKAIDKAYCTPNQPSLIARVETYGKEYPNYLIISSITELFERGNIFANPEGLRIESIGGDLILTAIARMAAGTNLVRVVLHKLTPKAQQSINICTPRPTDVDYHRALFDSDQFSESINPINSLMAAID